MGKLKTRYPVQVGLTFYMFLQNEQYYLEEGEVEVRQGNLLYEHIEPKFQEFIEGYNVTYEAIMFYRQPNDEVELIQNGWTLHINHVEEQGRHIMIIVRSYARYLKDLLENHVATLTNRIDQLETKLTAMQRQQVELRSQPLAPAPLLQHVSSMVQPPPMVAKDLDIGVLFSEPIFDEKKHKEANLPVDFRSQIQRLYSSLNNSYKPEITIECEIATKEHLRHLIGLKRPTVLHIICHGSKEGALEFEDDSKYDIGALCSIDKGKIREMLLEQKEHMPQLVFVNSCHSETIGRIFYECGARYVIMIDSQDKIDDEAAQIFSENFYRMLFRGERVGYAFREAKSTVGLKHNSLGCCCRHTSRQTHKEGCLWLQLAQQMGVVEAHKLFHVPSEKCSCDMRNFNRHKLTCEWAQHTLFAINRDFRIPTEAGPIFPKKKSQLPSYLPNPKELMICCCFNFEGEGKEKMIPHSECNKFKMLPQNQEETECLYHLQKSVAFSTTITDYSAPYLTQYHEKVNNISVMGRQQELYEFMRKIMEKATNLMVLYGPSGIGRTTFAMKSVTYLVERRVIDLWFFVDLYDIRDKAMFRNKFNEVTGLGYPGNKTAMGEVRAKQMFIILDNIDDFFSMAQVDFEDEIDGLRKELPNCKIIMSCKDRNMNNMENSPLLFSGCYLKQLKPLDQNVATNVLYSKIKSFLDISITYMDIRGIIAHKKELQIPKVIENLSHSFGNLKKKLKLDELKQKVAELGQGDFASNKLIEDNLNALKSRSREAYQMLIFISQFSQGIDQSDFNILSMYDRSEQNGARFGDSAAIDIPVDKHWKKWMAILFENSATLAPESLMAKESESESTIHSTATISFEKHQTSYELGQSQLHVTTGSDKEVPQEEVPSWGKESYFLEEVSQGRFIVKRFIRDFIWNKDKSEEGFYMKHIFVAYMAVLLDIYMKFQVEEKSFHEELLEYSDLSQTGIFKYKDNTYVQTSLTESIRYVEDYNSKFEKMLKEHPTLKEKIKSSEPSIFIMNHKLDFLHIYNFDWSKVYDYLKENRRREISVLTNYLQRLIILIPTALRVAQAEASLVSYSIHQSIQLLAQIRQHGKAQQNMFVTLKLKLMKAGAEAEKGNYDGMVPTTEFRSNFHKQDRERVSKKDELALNSQFVYEIEYLKLYGEHKRAKDEVKTSDYLMKKETLGSFAMRLKEELEKEEEWKSNQQCEILHAKRRLLLAMMYQRLLETSAKMPTFYAANPFINNFKNNYKSTFLMLAERAATTFLCYDLIKLGLKAKLTRISINLEFYKNGKANEYLRELEKEREKLVECEELYSDRKYNLVGFTNLDSWMKEIRNVLKEKLWEFSVNSLVIMTSAPLSNQNNPIIENVVRKKSTSRRDLEAMFSKAKIDLSIKFEILSAQKLQEETGRSCSMLVLNADTKIMQGRVFLALEGNDLVEQLLEVNAQMVQKYPLNKTKLLVLVGNNAGETVKKLKEIMGRSAPSLVAITSRTTGEFEEFADYSFTDLADSPTELKRVISQNSQLSTSELEVSKALIGGIIAHSQGHSLTRICQQVSEACRERHGSLRISFFDAQKDIIANGPGSFKNLSPGIRQTHNIKMEFLSNSESVYRRWKETTEVFHELIGGTEGKCLQVMGGTGVGKSTFVTELGRMCVERGMFESGVYVLDGKEIQRKHKSDIETYIKSQAEKGKMFNLSLFRKDIKKMAQQLLIVIDDYSLIKPKSNNNKLQTFMNLLVQHKVNLVLVTHENFHLRESLPSLRPRVVRLEKLSPTDLSVFAYSLLDPNNPSLIEDYEALAAHRSLNFADILDLYDSNRMSRAEGGPFSLMETNGPMKKVLSMQPTNN